MRTKSVLCLFISLILCVQGVRAMDTQPSESLTRQVLASAANDKLAVWSYYQQARDWLNFPWVSGSIREQLQGVRDTLHHQLDTEMRQSKLQALTEKKNLILSGDLYLQKSDPLQDVCIGWYRSMDMLSYAYDFPTALTIAVWWKESSCGYFLPKNGDGPFQIVSKDYSGTVLNRENFEMMIQDFLLFSKNKIDRYNKRNPDTPITLSYQKINQKDLLKFAALYNGLSGGTVYGDIQPASLRYFWDKVSEEFADGKRNGLFAQVLRVLQRELQQE